MFENKKPNKKRCFISINIPDEIAEKVQRVQEKLPEFRGKKIEKENLHLTLKFLGEVSSEKIEEIKKVLREIKQKSFDLEVKDIGVFSPKFIKIIWLYLEGAEELQKKVDNVVSENFGEFEKEKRFMSHLTIARVKNIEEQNKKNFLEILKSIEIPEISFPVKEFCLMSSELKPEGAEYMVLERFGLGSF